MKQEIESIGNLLYWAYANLAMAHVALKDNARKYDVKHYAIRKKLYIGLSTGTMDVKSFFDDERLKMILPQACCYCGSKEHLAADHVIPQKKGGLDIGENLIWACRACNSSKSATDLLEWMQKNNQFPSILLYRRYLKILISFCRDNDLMNTSLRAVSKIRLPFNLSQIPKDVLTLDSLKLWITDLSDEQIGRNNDLNVKGGKASGTQYQFRIANWNLERPLKNNKKTKLSLEKIKEIKADIFVLTETSNIVNLNGYHVVKSNEHADYPNEQACVIFSKWNIKKEIFKNTGSICALICAPFGDIIVHASIIPYHMSGVDDGGRYYGREYKVWERHEEEINDLSNIWSTIISEHKNIPIFFIGDFNQTRDGSQRGYGTNKCRNLLTEKLNQFNLTCITEENFAKNGKITEDLKKGKTRSNIDHICVSNYWLDKVKSNDIGAWDHFTKEGYYMSDHNGVYFDFNL